MATRLDYDPFERRLIRVSLFSLDRWCRFDAYCQRMVCFVLVLVSELGEAHVLDQLSECLGPKQEHPGLSWARATKTWSRVLTDKR